jgi:hypothetical protein
MADDLIQKALEQIAFHDAESARLKRWVNDADSMLGKEPRFGNIAAESATGSGANKPGAKKWNPGEFFNKPFAGAVKMILTDRWEAAGKNPAPASVDEIHEALSQGSFAFETAGLEAQKNSIRISLGKNSVTFVKLPNTDLFGLVEWYGKRPGKPGRKSAVEATEPAESAADIGEADAEVDGGEAKAAA